ncbi:DUF2780 domain-containing protein [Pseudomonas akapageensis]|uniref:DUF2780 domain-containing protein n=1 Tax=Pseudomonas akapageensis TaxID=2609961 RepID=UPI001407943B|nr:DUF2780 domain-containing protein [Pseudomonas akapageensis]
MKITRGFALATLMTLAASPVFAFNLGDAANAVAAMQGGNQNNGQTTAVAPATGLLNTLGTELKITPEQAIGGTGALLGLARNQLSPTDYAELSKSVPGLDLLSGVSALGSLGGLGSLLGNPNGTGTGSQSVLDNALGNVKNTNDLNNAFSALGMDTGMVGLFAPVVLQFLGQQGVAGSLLQSLGTAWGVAATNTDTDTDS